MKKIVCISFILSLLLLIVSCKKETKKYKIAGIISDPQLSTHVSGAKVILSGNKITSGVYNSSFVELGSATSDQNGKYSFEIEEANVAKYRISVIKNNYFDFEEYITTDILQASESFSKNINIFPQSTITLTVSNTSPQGMDDMIKWRFLNADQKCPTCCNSLAVIGTGPTYNQTTECKVVGNRYLLFEWTVTKSGNQHIYKDSVFMNCFQVINHTIHY